MIQKFFEFERYKTSYKQEIIAGITTFLTMSYIIVINPAILEAAGFPRGPALTATIFAAALGTLLMAFYAKRPFAIAPYMGENAFIAYSVVQVMGYSWKQALTAVFLAGVLFILLTILRVRSWLAEAIPDSLKYSFPVGIGLFLTLIGLNQSGIIAPGEGGAPLHVGNLASPSVLLAVGGIFLVAVLLALRVHGALLIAIVGITLLSCLLGITAWPEQILSFPPSLGPVMGQLSFDDVLTWKFLPLIIIIFVMAFTDTLGTLIGLSARAGLLDEKGNLPEIEKPMMVDAVTTTIAPLVGTTTAGAYLESAAGIEAGGRSGFTALVVAILFILSLFFAPLLTMVPPHAYGPSLVVVGLFMLEPIKLMDFKDYTNAVPSFLTIVLMSFTFNVGIGMTAGFISFVLLKLFTGRYKEIHPGMWLLALLSLLFFIFYPYTK
ncbi:MAG: NCS2 family permease [Candidatus Caenarcaniphilales bacterium]|nr:NCS2 family permease [Candidatus Caenarcaniphilales bacterium]